jgi:N-glycosylase/DNA lyase
MERTLAEARSRIPMNAKQVKTIISTMERDTKSKAARLRMAQAAISIGNVTPEGRDVWREYAASFK